jgi:hypothetical protein
VRSKKSGWISHPKAVPSSFVLYDGKGRICALKHHSQLQQIKPWIMMLEQINDLAIIPAH